MEGWRSYSCSHLCEFLVGRLALVLLLELTQGLVDLVQGTNLVKWQTDYTALLGQRLEYALTDPPHCVGDELEATGFVELLCSLDKTEVSLVDKVRKAQALVLVLLSNRYHKAEVCPCELFQCLLVSFTDTLSQFYFLIRSHQLFTADLLQVLVQ